MSFCYSCHVALNRKNQSFEHIIPNSIGGVLKSARLLCRACNGAYGMTIDVALAREFEGLASLIGLERDRPRSHTVKSVRTKVRFENGGLYLSGRSKQQMMQMAAGLQRKFPGMDLDSIESQTEEEGVSADQDITIHFSVGSDLLMRAVAKIAVNYYLMKARGGQYLRRIIAVMDGVAANHQDVLYTPLPGGLWGDQEISHMISVKGDASSGQLYAQVILFNTYSLVVNLCDAYDGEQVDLFYRYDIRLHREIREKIEWNYSRSELLSKAQGQPGEWNKELMSSMQGHLIRVLHIARPEHSKSSLKEVVERTFDKAISQFPMGTIMTQDMVSDVHRAVFAQVNEWLKGRG